MGGEKIKKSVTSWTGINPKYNKDISEKIVQVENLTKEVEIPTPSYTYGHLVRKKKGGKVKKKK